MRGIIFVAAIAAFTGGMAQAGERTAHDAIAAGNLPAAERTLIAERRIFPDRPELMLNLAAVYQRTGRPSQASTLYRDVLARPAVAMDMPSGATRSSHEIADLALSRLASVTVASR